MAEPILDLANTQPIVMRWVETVSDGSRNWYLAALQDDAKFWGYVHVRTDSLNENRSFDGQLDESTYSRIRSLVDSIDDADSDSDSNESCDGLIGLGSRANFTTIIRYHSASTDLPNAQIFQTIVGLLQSKLITAAKL